MNELYGYVNTDATSTTTTASFSVVEIVERMRRWRAEQNAIDEVMVRALARYIDQSGGNLIVWAERLRIPVVVLTETLSGMRPVSGHFWDQVRRVFEPLRQTGGTL